MTTEAQASAKQTGESLPSSSRIGLRLLIGGRWVLGQGPTLSSVNPARPDEIVAEGPQAGSPEVEAATAAANLAWAEWSRTPIHERGAVLARAASCLESNPERLGLELTREEGKTLAEGIGEVLRAAQILRYFGNEGERAAGQHFASPRRGERILVTRKPLGVVAVVTPFNFPIAIPAWKIAPALVHGNTVVWKPASTVPLLAMRLAEALTDAGLPPGVLNLLIGPGTIGTELVQHPSIDGMTFTGSTEVGRSLACQATSRGIPFQAEMGGKNAAVVLADADLDLASEQVLNGAFRSSGQKCTATSRLILAESVAEPFLDRLESRLAAWRVGDPTDNGVDMGPVITEAARRSILARVSEAVGAGARPAAGTADASAYRDSSGAFVAPRVLELPPGRAGAANIAWREELFGPVLALRRAGSTEEALGLANDSQFGLSASLFTRDIGTALEAVDSLNVGVLHINSESAGADPHVPFGGEKKSGYGPKEQGPAAKDFFTHTTTVYLRG